jgi:hypothetical protein
MTESKKDKSSDSDLLGAGQIINSQVAKWTYKDGLSESVKQVGHLTTDTLKTFRLFAAPLQLLAAYQDRFESFCDRVRERVPESEQCDAAAEIARPVMEAFASTSDDSPLMSMFEELMAKAIDKREAHKLSPEFPEIIKTLSPLEAYLISEINKKQHYVDSLVNDKESRIYKHLGANFDLKSFDGENHHLTLVQNLENKKLVVTLMNQEVPNGTYPDLDVPEGLRLNRMICRLSMYGHWFANSVTDSKSS